jgi:NHLM bacteriocin system ABC transporter peptidase/ATP-binding protein
MEAAECGAAALGMILGYYGRYVPLEKLRLECGVSRDGSKASNMVKVARDYAFDAKGWKKEPNELKTVPLPVIIFWEFNHFVVVEGYDRKYWYINDPATGPRRVPIAEFDESFTGIVLTFSPGPAFAKGGARHSLLRSLRDRARGAAAPLTYAVIAGLALVIPGLIIPTFSKIFVDEFLVGGMEYWVRPLLLGMGVTVILYALLSWLQQYCLRRMEIKLALTTSGKFLLHVLRLPIEFFTQRYGGEVGSRVAINDRVAQLLSGDLATNILNCLMVAFYAILMLQYDFTMTMAGVAIALLNLMVLRYVSRKRKDLNMLLLQNAGKMMGTAMSGLLMIETFKATGSESDLFARWSGYLAKTLNVQQQIGVYTQLLNVVPPFLATLNNAVMLGLGGFLVMQGNLSIGELIAFQGYMASFSMPINRLVLLGGQLQEAEGDMNRLDDVLHYPPDRQLAESELADVSTEPLKKLSGHLELKDVTFGYSRMEPPLIENFNLKLTPGSRVALVGPSGSGKSTISRLVSGLYQPWSGEILLDGKPHSKISRRVLSHSLALVDQDIFMFEDAVRENLALWDPSIPMEDIVEAAKDARIHEDIAARAGGYENLVKEGGINFSGGQRQRLEIARALVRNPSVLVLDEATSAMDPVTEQAIDENLRRRGCTCLIVAHRLSTIRDCDEIIVLDRGKVVERGTHDELVKTAGAYYDLIKQQ